MAILMFFTSVGFAVDMHYCQGHLKSVSFFGKAKSCHEMANAAPMKNCPRHQKMRKQEKEKDCSEDKNCCTNKTLHFQSNQDQQVQTFNFSANQPLQQFVIAFVVAFFSKTFIENDTPSFAHYIPPLILRDIPVLIQSFLL